MGYVIAAVLVVLIVGGIVLLLVTNATKKSNVSDAGDPGADQNALGIIGSDDETPAGDTSQHAGEQTEDGTTVSGQDGGREGDVGPYGVKRQDSPDVARPVVGGEAEGGRSAG